jgi:hypothetical protein
MIVRKIFIVFALASFVVAPAFAGQKSMKNTSTAANNCKMMVKAKKVAKADFQGELNKCLDNPGAYQ